MVVGDVVEGTKLVEHAPEERVHELVEKVPDALEVQVMVPFADDGDTVAVHVVGAPLFTGEGVQLTVVVVELAVIVKGAVAEFVPSDADTVAAPGVKAGTVNVQPEKEPVSSVVHVEDT